MKKAKLLFVMLLVVSLGITACGKEEQRSETKKKVVRFEKEQSDNVDIETEVDIEAEEESKAATIKGEEKTSAVVDDVQSETTKKENEKSAQGHKDSADQTTVSTQEWVDSNSNSNRADTEVVIPGFNDSDTDSSSQQGTNNSETSENVGASDKTEQSGNVGTSDKTEQSDKTDNSVQDNQPSEEISGGKQQDDSFTESPDEGFWTDAV